MNRGWFWPENSRKAHYFTEDRRSLCVRWAVFTDDFSDDDHRSPDNCKECMKRREKLYSAVPQQEPSP